MIIKNGLCESYLDFVAKVDFRTHKQFKAIKNIFNKQVAKAMIALIASNMQLWHQCVLI